jgi:hypothetical protein
LIRWGTGTVLCPVEPPLLRQVDVLSLLSLHVFAVLFREKAVSEITRLPDWRQAEFLVFISNGFLADSSDVAQEYRRVTIELDLSRR